MSQNEFISVHHEIAAYYTEKFREFGATAKGVDWRDAASHRLRHEQFLYLLNGDMSADVCDLGCGFGDFFSFLHDAGFEGKFTGYDISADMLVAARRLHIKSANCSWKLGGVPEDMYDYIIASGIFNVRRNIEIVDWERYIFGTIDRMARASRKGFAFNMLTSYSDSDRQRADLYYGDPKKLFEYCVQKFSRRVALLHDTALFEFTLIVRLST